MLAAAQGELAKIESGGAHDIDLYADTAPLRALRGRSCCCGCPLSLGAYLVLGIHFAANATVVGLTVASLFTRVEGVNTAPIQTTFNFVYALAGLPLILFSFYCVRTGKAFLLWIYVGYLMLTVCYDTWCALSVLALNTQCAGLKEYLTPQGQNAVCGLLSANSGAIVAMIFLAQLYAVWLMWSFILGIGERDPLGDVDTLLALTGKRALRRYGFKDLAGDIVGELPGMPSLRVRNVGNWCWCLWCCNDESEDAAYLDPYANVRHTPKSKFMTGYPSTRGGIFRGTFHDTRYPAPTA